jgi:hypothetical protein
MWERFDVVWVAWLRVEVEEHGIEMIIPDFSTNFSHT